MSNANKAQAAELYSEILTAVADSLISAIRPNLNTDITAAERIALQKTLDDLVSLYMRDPTAVGGHEGAAWALNRLRAALGRATEPGVVTYLLH